MIGGGFDQVVAWSLVAYPCSPKLPVDGGFRGIRISAPARAHLDEKPLAIVCGAIRLDSDYLALDGAFLRRLVVVAADTATHRSFAGKVQGPWRPPRRRTPLLSSAPRPRCLTTYFNPDIREALSLPREDADYVVYAALGAHVSNVVKIEIRRSPDEGGE